MKKKEFLQLNNKILQNRIVLDLACHTGKSTDLILQNNAKHVYAVDIRPNLIEQAKATVVGNVDFYVGDITNPDLICPLVSKSQTITFFGALYHLFDHFRFFSHILKPNIEHVLIETEFGTESANPEMVWGFENIGNILHGWAGDCKIIPNGTPNLSWIINSAQIFGFKCDWVHCYGRSKKMEPKNLTHEDYLAIRGPSWPTYNDVILEKDTVPQFVLDEINQMLSTYPAEDRRMILRLYNSKIIDSVPLDINDIYKWPL